MGDAPSANGTTTAASSVALMKGAASGRAAAAKIGTTRRLESASKAHWEETKRMREKQQTS